MNKISNRTRSITLKAMCTAMVLVLGGSLFAAGAMDSNGCGMKCCCQSGPASAHRSAEQQMRSPMGCCSGVPLSPCDLQSTGPLELPEIIPAACCGPLSHADGPVAVLAAFDDGGQNGGANFISQFRDPEYTSPPLFLQKLSLLI